MDTQQGAREILAHVQAVYVPKHDYISVRETDFLHLDLRFYQQVQATLQAKGFIHLEDCEDRTLSAAPGNVLMPVMIRTMVSSDGATMVAIYHPRIRPLWLRVLTKLLRKHPAKTIDFETEFSDRSFICTTNADTASAVAMPALVRTEYLDRATLLGSLLQRHEERVAEKARQPGVTIRCATTIEQVRASQDRMSAIKAAFRHEIGGVTEAELVTLAGGRPDLAKEVHDEIQKIRVPQADYADADGELLAAVKARGENAGGTGGSSQLLLLTAVLFVVLGGFRWGWMSVVFLTVAIALHEIGHVIAMRIFGYKNVRMLFLPLFGGLATGEPRELDATKNALVSLAGPAFGLATAVLAILVALLTGQPSWLVQFAWVSLILNGFNLIPFVPLDGGQFTNDALFSRMPILELMFRLLAVAGLGWMAFQMGAWLLGGVALFMLITTQVTYRRACIIRDTRRDPAWQTRALDREAVALLREMVKKQFKGVAAAKYQSKMPMHVHGFWLEIRKRFPGVGATIGLLGAYVFMCLIVLPTIGFVMVWFLERPTF